MKKGGLVRNAGAMSIAVLISRFLGLIREQVFAYLFGAGFYSDASLVAYRIPNLLRDLLAEGALSSSFVSVFSKEKTQESKQQLYFHVCRLLVWVLLIITLGIFVFSEQIVTLMAGAFKQIPGKFELTVELTRLLSPFLFFTSMAALSMGLLNSLGIYFLPSLGAAAFNVASIFVGGVGAYLAVHYGDGLRDASFVFALGTLLGGALSWMIQWKAQHKQGFSPFIWLRNFFNLKEVFATFKDPRIQRILSMLAPAVLTVGVLQVNIFVNTGLASELAEGSVTWLNYAYRLLHFPMGVFGVSLFMAALPKLSEVSRDKIAFQSTLNDAVALSLYVSIGAAVGLFVFAEPIMAVLFEHGRFSSLDVTQSALALQAYSVGLLAFNVNKIFSSAFFAIEKVWIPALLSLVSVVANYFFSSYLSRFMGHAGIALSVSLTSLLTSLLLYFVLRSKGTNVSLVLIFRVLLGSVLCCAPMFVFYYFNGATFLWNLKSHGLHFAIAAVLVAILLMGLSFLGLSVLFLKEGRSFYTLVLKPKLGRFKL